MIAAARAALEGGDAREALVQLLAGWRATPATALAEAIEAVGIVAARGMHPPGGTDAEDREARWFAEAVRADPVTRQRLVETIRDTSPVSAKVARARKLAETETDPRIAMSIVALVTARSMPWHAQHTGVWNPLLEMLARSGDPRVVQAIEHAPWHEVVLGSPRQKAAFHKRVAKWVTRLASALPVVPPLAYEDGRIVDDILAMARRPTTADARDDETAAALLAAVHAAPGELGARAIYADWLQEHGDPRGEFIALQLAHVTKVPPEIRTRLEQLLAQHRVTWTGGVDEHLASSTFRRGFLEDVTFRKQGAYGTPYFVPPPDPMWLTVRVARGGIPASDALPMPILERALEIDHRGLRTLARLAQPPPLTELEWLGSDPAHDGEAVADFAALVPRVPTLHTLTIRGEGAEALAWAWQGSSIRVLVVEAPSARVRYWLGHMLERIEVRHDGWTTTLDAVGRFIARQGNSGNFAAVLPYLEGAIEALADRVTHLDITVRAKHEWRIAERSRVAAMLARHPTWTSQLYGYKPPP